MIQFTEKDITVNICTNIIEWAKEFYNMPDGAELVNEDEVSHNCMGFSSIDEKIVWIYLPKNYDLRELKEIISHEIGHIIELQFTTNPEQIESNNNLHELKADHYMNYYLLVDKIVADIESYNNGKPIVNGSLPNCSTQLSSCDCDLDRLYDWIMDNNRQPAKTAFTSGSLRKVADEIEFRLWRQ